jgi:hypothetical protein
MSDSSPRQGGRRAVDRPWSAKCSRAGRKASASWPLAVKELDGIAPHLIDALEESAKDFQEEMMRLLDE